MFNNGKGIRNVLVFMTVIFGKIVVFLFDAILVGLYGVGIISDAFIMAYSIPSILFDGVVTAIIMCYIPFYDEFETKYLNKTQLVEKRRKYSNNLLFFFLVLSVVFTFIFRIFQNQILSLYAKGFSGESKLLLNRFTSALIWIIPISAACSIFRAYLQVNEKKAESNIGQIITYAVLIVGAIFCFPNYNALGYIGLLGNAFTLLVLIVISCRNGFRFKFFVSLKESYMVPFFSMMLPVMLGTLIGEINSIIDKFYGSMLTSGIVTDLTLGYKLSFSIQGIISTSLVIIIYPLLTKSAAEGLDEKLSYHIGMSYSVIYWIAVPIIIGGLILSRKLIYLIFGHGNFDDGNLLITSNIFSVYLLGVLPTCLKQVCDRTFYALKKSKYSLISTIVAVVSNLFLDLLLFDSLEYIGLTIATVVSIILSLIMQLLLLKKHNQKLVKKEHFLQIYKPLIASIIMGLSIILLSILFNRMGFFMGRFQYLEVVFDCIIGVLVYFVVTLVFFKTDFINTIKYLKNN